MPANRPRQDGTLLLLLLGGLLAAVGCDQSTLTADIAEASGDRVTAAPSADLSTAASATTSTGATAEACCRDETTPDAAAEATAATVQHIPGGIVLPDVKLVNEHGRPVDFHSQLIENKIVAINFIFTTCKGICPPMGANFAQLQRELGDRFGDEVALVSVSVDPGIDTPQRLHAWRDKFGGGPGWTLLTGDKRDVDYLLKEMEVFTADKNDHSPFILIGDEASGKWSRVHGLTSPEKLAEIIADLHAARHQPPAETAVVPDEGNALPQVETVEQQAHADLPAVSDAGRSGQGAPADSPPAQRYFTDVELINHHGQNMRLYSDVLQGKVVVINSFFSTCKGSCPVMLSSFAKIQDQFADRLGQDLYLVSITVDPQTDTPERLASYAEQWNARPGWIFLTGEKANVDTALYKLGHYVEQKESHSNVFIIGNEATGLWKKARGLSEPETLFPLIEEVLNDKLEKLD